jgi:uncharacterized membrane protein YccC
MKLTLGQARPHVADVRRFARTLLGCTISYCGARLATLPELYWAVITTLIVVTQPSLNQAINTSRDQVIGACIGALVGVAGIVAVNAGFRPLAVFAVALVPLAALTAWRPTLRLACVTLVIVVLIPASGSPFERPIARVLEILIGAAAAFVATVLLPNRALQVAHERATALLASLAELVNQTLAHAGDPAQIRQLDTRCATTAAALAEALTEAGRENVIVPLRRSLGDDIVKVAPLLQSLHRDVQFLAQASAAAPALAGQWACDPAVRRVAQAFGAVMQALEALLQYEPERAKPGAPHAGIVRLEETLQDFTAACDAPQAGRGNAAVLPFVMTLLVQDLHAIAGVFERAE